MEPVLNDTYLLYVILSVLMPIVVAFVTKQDTLGKYKAYVLLALSSLNGIFVAAQTNGGFDGFDWKTAIVGAVVSFVVSFATHAGLYKPTHLTGSEGVIQEKTANIGF